MFSFSPASRSRIWSEQAIVVYNGYSRKVPNYITAAAGKSWLMDKRDNAEAYYVSPSNPNCGLGLCSAFVKQYVGIQTKTLRWRHREKQSWFFKWRAIDIHSTNWHDRYGLSDCIAVCLKIIIFLCSELPATIITNWFNLLGKTHYIFVESYGSLFPIFVFPIENNS